MVLIIFLGKEIPLAILFCIFVNFRPNCLHNEYKSPVAFHDMTSYNDEIDRVIRQVLYSDKKPYKFRQLRRELGKVMNRPNISFDTFSLHLKRMVFGRILQKNGKDYSLTKECRNKMEKGSSIDSRSYNYLNRSIDDNHFR